MRRLIDNGTTSPARPPYIGHYGHLRKAYLEGYRPDLYNALVASETLYEHCAEIEAAVRRRLDLIIPQLAEGGKLLQLLRKNLRKVNLRSTELYRIHCMKVTLIN